MQCLQGKIIPQVGNSLNPFPAGVFNFPWKSTLRGNSVPLCVDIYTQPERLHGANENICLVQDPNFRLLTTHT